MTRKAIQDNKMQFVRLAAEIKSGDLSPSEFISGLTSFMHPDEVAMYVRILIDRKVINIDKEGKLITA